MANNLAAFTPVKYSLKLVELLYNETLYTSITNTKYEGEIKDFGDRVRVRTAAKITLSAYTKGMTLTRQDLNPTSEDLIIDQAYYFSFGVDDIDKMQNDVEAIDEYANTSKRDMEELLDTDLLVYGRKQVNYTGMIGTNYSTGTAAVAATTGVVTGSGTTFTSAMVGSILKHNASSHSFLVTAFSSSTSITVKDLDGVAYTGGALADGAYVLYGATAVGITKSTVYSYIVALRTAMGQQKAHKKGRWLVVNSQFEGLLLQAPEFIPAVDKAYNDVVQYGLIGTIAGFKIYQSELVDGNNTTGYWFLAGNGSFLHFACQIMKTSVVPSESDPNSFMSTCKGLLVWGRKVFEGTRAHGAVLRATMS